MSEGQHQRQIDIATMTLKELETKLQRLRDERDYPPVSGVLEPK